VPHRLNSDERVLYDLARRKGFLEMAGSGWRKQRSDAPLANTYRSWCDAAAVGCLVLHKSNPLDELVLDLSPLRSPASFTDAAAFCLSLPGAADGVIVEAGSSLSRELPTGYGAEAGEEAEEAEEAEEGVQSGAELLAARADAFATEPIYRLPALAISWARPRSDAKALAKLLAKELLLAAPASKNGGSKGRSRSLGAPTIKPGKSRRHGGYGIG